MQYFRVMNDCDGKALYKKNRNSLGIPVLSGYYLIAGELFTKSEMKRLNIPMQFVMPVKISKNDIYFSFGARFSVTGAKEEY